MKVEHLVLFKPVAGITEAQVKFFLDKLNELRAIDGIVDFSAGLNHSKEGLSKGFEIGMKITFRDQAALDAYLPSEKHQAVVSEIKPLFEDVIVVDFDAGVSPS